jgi:two-component system response regulator PrrA
MKMATPHFIRSGIPMRVMLVDDDAPMRQVLARLLRTSGFDSVAEVGDGHQALHHLKSEQVDLIVTDCSMPNMDGIALVTALRARGDQTPVIMLSGQDDPQLIVRAIRAGVNNYIPKPIHPENFFEKIWQTLGVARAIAM